jgi:uncharacterized protein (TIGR04255 family)
MQTDFPHLDKAPIREAVLDIKVEPRAELTPEVFGAFVEKLKGEFPEANPIRTVQAEFDVRGEEPGIRSSAAQTLGNICWNEPKTRAVQGRLDGFTVNHVQGYESWQVLRSRWSTHPRVAPSCAMRCC